MRDYFARIGTPMPELAFIDTVPVRFAVFDTAQHSRADAGDTVELHDLSRQLTCFPPSAPASFTPDSSATVR